MASQGFTISGSYEEALDRAAALWGIEPEYWDIWGRRHITSPDAKKSILSALGVAADSKPGLDRAIEERLRREWARVLPPCMVISENAVPYEILIQMPVEQIGRASCRERDEK